MKEEAIEKINDELKSNIGPVVNRIGVFLKNHVERYPDDAAKVLAVDKTLKGAFGAMKDEAKKSQVGGCGVMTDEEGYALVLRYFEIDTLSAPDVPKQTEVQAPRAGALNISLDDLL